MFFSRNSQNIWHFQNIWKICPCRWARNRQPGCRPTAHRQPAVGRPRTDGPLSVPGPPTARCRSAADRQRLGRPSSALFPYIFPLFFFKKCVLFFERTGHIRSRIEMIQTSKLLVSTSLTTLMLNILSEKVIFMYELIWLKWHNWQKRLKSCKFDRSRF